MIQISSVIKKYAMNKLQLVQKIRDHEKTDVIGKISQSQQLRERVRVDQQTILYKILHVETVVTCETGV